MEDETLELHFKTIDESFERTHSALQEVAEAQQNHASRITDIETSLTTISEKIRSNPLLTLGTGTIGGGSIIGAIAYYLQQGGTPIP